MTPLLYLPGDISISHAPAFSCQALHLTQNLLRYSQPTTARRIEKLLGSIDTRQLKGVPIHLYDIDNHQLLDALSAPLVGNIIDGLTDLGNQWLRSPTCSTTSRDGLRALLEQWIDYGDWVIANAKPL